MPTRLKYEKLATLLTQNDYDITAIYYTETDKRIVFVECRLPKSRKGILVFIPDRYVILIPPRSSIKIIEIIKSTLDHDMQYIDRIRGDFIKSDLAIISADGICHVSYNDDPVCYFFSVNFPKQKEEPEDPISMLEQALIKTGITPTPVKIAKPDILKTDLSTLLKAEIESVPAPDVGVPTPTESTPATTVGAPTPVTESTPVDGTPAPTPTESTPVAGTPATAKGVPAPEPLKEGLDSDVSVKIDLVFQMNEDPKSPTPGLEPEPEPEVEVDNISTSTITNHVIFEDLDVSIGIIYVLIDLVNLYKNIKTYEDDALEIYGQLDDSEKEIRVERLDDIKIQLHRVEECLEQRMAEIQVSEDGIRHQLTRLTTIFQETNSFTSTNSPLQDKVDAVNTVCKGARKMASEMNIELMQHRDNVEDLLVNFEESLKELYGLCETV